MEITVLEAIENAKPKPPRVHELGGGLYYTCYRITCNESLHRWQRFCPMCGQRILWEDGKNDSY